MNTNNCARPGSGDTRLEQMLEATNHLPAPQQAIFHALFVDGLGEGAAAVRLRITPEALLAGKHSMLRSLKGLPA